MDLPYEFHFRSKAKFYQWRVVQRIYGPFCAKLSDGQIIESGPATGTSHGVKISDKYYTEPEAWGGRTRDSYIAYKYNKYRR